MIQMAKVPSMEHLPAARLGEPEVRAAPSADLTTTAPAAHQDSGGDGQWVELPRRFSFTFAGIFVGAARFRCMALVRPLGQPPYPLTPSLFRLLPEGVRALHISSQTISAKLPRISRLGREICYVPMQGTRFFVDLNGSFEAYLGKFNNKTRYTMRRKMRRFTEACNGAVAWQEFRCAKDMAEFHGLASGVSRKSYQHRLLRAGIDISSSFREEMVRGAIEGQSRGYILFRQQTPIAYMFCQARCGDLIVGQMGFDPAFAADSPGSILMWLMLERLFAGGEFRRLDLGEGEYPYKAHLATGSCEVAEIYCFRWNFRNAALVLMHSAVAGAASLLRSALEVLGVAQRLKKMIRYGIGRAPRS
jgi:Acetyltransferase (GNAT) domain